MALKQIVIDNILGGWQPSEYFALKGQFLNSVGIDPEMPKDDSTTRPSGLIRPTAMANIASNLTGACLWLTGTNKDSLTYGYNSDGKVFTLDSSYALAYLNSGSALTGAANGLEYYNNYVYYAGNVDVIRYGPLVGTTPSFNTTFWTGTLAKTALTNTTYPSINGIAIPNHPMCVHKANNRIYFGDVKSDGTGIISMIKTKKVTYEGDTDDTTVPSAYNVLDLYTGWYPTCISSYNSMIAIGVIDGTSTTVKQQNAKVVFWSTLSTDTGYNLVVELPDPLITALKFVNGVLYAFTGNATGGCRISQYIGGRTFQEIMYLDDTFPPFQGAVDYLLGKLVFGGKMSVPQTAAVTYSFGGKQRALAMGIHCPQKTTSAGSSPMATAVKYLAQGATAQPVVAWKDGSLKGIDKPSTTYISSGNVLRSEIFRVSESAKIVSIRIPVVNGMAANKSFTVQAHYDDDSAQSSVITVSNTTNPSEKFIHISREGMTFKNNFFLEFINTGTALCVLGLPITIEIETGLD